MFRGPLLFCVGCVSLAATIDFRVCGHAPYVLFVAFSFIPCLWLLGVIIYSYLARITDQRDGFFLFRKRFCKNSAPLMLFSAFEKIELWIFWRSCCLEPSVFLLIILGFFEEGFVAFCSSFLLPMKWREGSCLLRWQSSLLSWLSISCLWRLIVTISMYLTPRVTTALTGESTFSSSKNTLRGSAPLGIWCSVLLSK